MITEEQVIEAYEMRAKAFREHADNRYQLADYANNLNLQFAQQESIKNHGKPFDPITGALIEPKIIDITPTWSEILLTILRIFEDSKQCGADNARKIAIDQLRVMAELADMYNESVKKDRR